MSWPFGYEIGILVIVIWHAIILLAPGTWLYEWSKSHKPGVEKRSPRTVDEIQF